jgi:hypothetical protein
VTITPTKRLVVTGAGIVAVVVAAVWLASDQAQGRAMLPVIDAYLDRDAGRLGFGGDLSDRLKPRMFCDASIIEIRPADTLSAAGVRPFTVSCRVGIVMNCGEFARRGHTLLEGSAGYPGIGAAALVLSNRATAPDPVRQACRAFSLPPTTRAIEG